MDTDIRIRHLRTVRGETRNNLACAIGVHPTTVHHWEMLGTRPNEVHMARLLAHFNLTVGEFYSFRVPARKKAAA